METQCEMKIHWNTKLLNKVHIFQTILPIQQKEPLKIVELISPTVCTLQGTKWDICQKKS